VRAKKILFLFLSHFIYHCSVRNKHNMRVAILRAGVRDAREKGNGEDDGAYCPHFW
jgi:hypothetical protein